METSDILFYGNLLVFAGSLVLYARRGASKKSLWLQVGISVVYSALFMVMMNRSGANMRYLIEHYWTLALAVHWFVLLAWVVFRLRRSEPDEEE